MLFSIIVIFLNFRS